MAGESVVNSLREKTSREPRGIINTLHISFAIALLVGGRARASRLVYFSKGFTSQMIESVGTLGRARFGQTPATRCLHREYLWATIRPRRVRFRNSVHPRSE